MTNQGPILEIDKIHKASQDWHEAYAFLFGRILIAAPGNVLTEDYVDNLKSLLDSVSKYNAASTKAQILEVMAKEIGGGSVSNLEISNKVTLYKDKSHEMDLSMETLFNSMALTKNWSIVLRSAFADYRDASRNLGYAEVGMELLRTLERTEF